MADIDGIVLLEKLPSGKGFALKQPVRIVIERLGHRKFRGSFADLPLIMEADGGTRQSIIKQLGEGLIYQYELVAKPNNELGWKIKTACETCLQPVQ